MGLKEKSCIHFLHGDPGTLAEGDANVEDRAKRRKEPHVFLEPLNYTMLKKLYISII